MNSFTKYNEHRAAVAAYAWPGPAPRNRFQYKPGFRDPKFRSVKSEPIGYGHLMASGLPDDMDELSFEVGRRARNDRDFTIMKGDPVEDHYITLDQMKKSYGAVEFLNCKGFLFNVFYTCTFASMYMGLDWEIHDARKKHFNHLYHWAQYRGFDLHHQWVVERGKKRGLHVHALIHVPENLIPALKHEAEQSLLTISHMRARRPTPPNVFCPEGNDTMTLDFQINTDVELQWRRWKYMMEGLNPHITVSVCERGKWNAEPIGDYLGLRHHSYQGRYTKKRFGMSKTLGLGARRKFEAKYGELPDVLEYASSPDDLYGPQFLHWSKRNMGEVKLLKSLDI